MPSNSLTFTVTPLASSNGPSSAGSAWSHQTSALSSAAPTGVEAMAATAVHGDDCDDPEPAPAYG